MVLTASLPPNSKMREKLSQTLVGTLWDSLQHPPLSYYGDIHQYRTADGSYNVWKGSSLPVWPLIRAAEHHVPGFWQGWDAIRKELSFSESFAWRKT